MSRKFVIMFFILATLWSCKQPSADNCLEKGIVEVELRPSADTLKLGTLFKLNKLVAFDSLLLSDILEVQLIDSVLLVQSKCKNKDLHLFDCNGKYIKSFVHYGRADDEILNLQSFCFNKYNNTVDVLCNYGMLIKQFSFPDGKLCNRIVLPEKEIVSIADFEILDSTSYMFYKNSGFCDGDEYKLYHYNYVTSKIENRFFKLDKELAEKISIGQYNNLYVNDSDLYFYESFLDGIYVYQRDSLDVKRKVYFKPNEFSLPDKILRNLDGDELDFINRCKDSDYIWAHVNCWKFRDKIFSRFTYNRKLYINMLDLIRQESSAYSYIYDDILFGQYYTARHFRVVGCSNQYLICTIEEYSMEIGKSYILLLENR